MQVSLPPPQEHIARYTSTQQQQTSDCDPKQHISLLYKHTIVCAPVEREQVTVDTQTQQTKITQRKQKLASLYTQSKHWQNAKFIQSTSQSTAGTHTTKTTEHKSPGLKENVSTEDVLACLNSNHSYLTLEAEELWVSFVYSGNSSGSPCVHVPSTCWLQVRGLGNGTISLLIFNVTCFTNNQFGVHSKMKNRVSFNCDPTAWVAPGFELAMTSNWANLSIDMKDEDTPFSLHAQLKIVQHRRGNRLEMRKVTDNLGTPLYVLFLKSSGCTIQNS